MSEQEKKMTCFCPRCGLKITITEKGYFTEVVATNEDEDPMLTEEAYGSKTGCSSTEEQ